MPAGLQLQQQLKHSAVELPFLTPAFQGALTSLAVSDRQGFVEGSLVT